MKNEEIIIEHIQESINMKEKLKELAPIILKITNIIINAFKSKKKIILCGNGGSAADAQHIAGEFIGKFYKNRKALPAIALNTNTSVLTGLGNDYGFNSIFKRQAEAHLQEGDVIIGLSTSGNSPNVVSALEYARANGGITVAFVGKDDCDLDKIAEFLLKIPSNITPRIQEGHITVAHIICYLVEAELFPDA
jgi:D-sedoheptulose 7-phosphate isomerase